MKKTSRIYVDVYDGDGKRIECRTFNGVHHIAECVKWLIQKYLPFKDKWWF